MKVKDFIGWLQGTRWTANGVTWHYFPNKKKSACGKVKHPTKMFQALYIQGDSCKICERIHGKRL